MTLSRLRDIRSWSYCGFNICEQFRETYVVEVSVLGFNICETFSKLTTNEIYSIYYWTMWTRAYLPCHDVGFGLATQNLQPPQKLKTKPLKYLVNQTHTHMYIGFSSYLQSWDTVNVNKQEYYDRKIYNHEIKLLI